MTYRCDRHRSTPLFDTALQLDAALKFDAALQELPFMLFFFVFRL
jgi:hypothetical protein